MIRFSTGFFLIDTLPIWIYNMSIYVFMLKANKQYNVFITLLTMEINLVQSNLNNLLVKVNAN